MATDTSAINNALGASTATTASTAKKTSSIDSNEFMNLLVAQLKNQDPMNPMDNQEFAVQLAQFSQLEQLVSINEKITKDTSSTGDLSSLASYLGHEVVTNSDVVTVKNNNGGSVVFDLTNDATNVEVQLVDASGSVVESKQLGALESGKQHISLNGLTTSNGSYQVKVVATSGGVEVNPQAYAAGIVSGVIPGLDPKLIVNGIEIGTGDVKEVALPS